jgi:ribosomal protein S26
MAMVVAFKHAWERYRDVTSLRFIVPALSACLMTCASIVPWLKEPSGGVDSAWKIPIDIGWQVRLGFFSYGVLCLCCTIYLLLMAYTNWPTSDRLWRSWYPFVSRYLKNTYVWASLLCLLPCVLFCLQYLVFDVQGIDQLTQQKVQVLLIQQHLGYNIYAPHIPINPFTLDTAHLAGRVTLLANQLSFGPLLPCLGTIILLGYRNSHWFSVACIETHKTRKQPGLNWWIKMVLFVCAVMVLLGRVPLATICQYEVSASLMVGDYEHASWWLDQALFFEPALNQVASYHIQRGQIQYFLYHDEQSDDARAFIASVDFQRTHYQDAYQQLFAIWTMHHDAPWVLREIDTVLEQFVESKHALVREVDQSLTIQARKDNAALPQLQRLAQLDPANIYAHYAIGRIDYDLHNYIDCTIQMQNVIQLASNQDVQSSAYTYIGLSEASQGNYITSRVFLLKAVALDPHYYNSTAREELSGLR